MIRRILYTAAMATVLTTAGCSSMIVGDWRSIEPADVPPEVARIRQISFGPDGRFQARLVRNHRTWPIEGTYEFAGDRLHLVQEGQDVAQPVSYEAAISGNVLRLTQNSRTVRLGRDYAGSPATQPATLPEQLRVEAQD